MAAVIELRVAGSRDQHDAADAKVEEALGELGGPPDGLMFHLSWPDDDGFVVIDRTTRAAAITAAGPSSRSQLEQARSIRRRGPVTPSSCRWACWIAPATSTASRRVEPILGVDFDFDVDLRNRAPHPVERRGPHQVGLTFTHPDGAEQIPVDDVTLAVSYDDGETWQEVRGIQQEDDNRYVATLDSRSAQPASEFLSVQVSAADVQGNNVHQEIIRAYALP